MGSLLVLFLGISALAWGIKHRTSDDDRQKYDKSVENAGLKPSPGFDAAFEARKSQTRSNGNVAIGVGVIMIIAAFLGI